MLAHRQDGQQAFANVKSFNIPKGNNGVGLLMRFMAHIGPRLAKVVNSNKGSLSSTFL
jgi:hypothetical protein